MILLILSFGTNLTVQRIVSPISSSFFVPGGIASLVGILDEFHQAYIPGRDSSISDVMLDITGITLTAIFVHFFQQRRKK
jgi:VanZ family protein